MNFEINKTTKILSTRIEIRLVKSWSFAKINSTFIGFLVANAITKKNETIPNHIKVLKQFCKLLKIKKMRRILLFTLCINLISSVYAQKEGKRKTIDSLTTEMTISEGLINTYSNYILKYLKTYWEKIFLLLLG